MATFDDPPATLTEVLARDAIGGLTRTVIRDLQQLRGEHTQSGPESGLRDVWDEICVQVQLERSPLWDAYLAVLEATVERRMRDVGAVRLKAIWLQTRRGQAWIDEVAERGRGEATPSRVWNAEDVLEHLRERVLSVATEWSNARIRRYLQRA